jgi:tagatose-6-phosphate ketose/aldose isomerase
MALVKSVHGLRTIFTGAGSSAFIGESMQMLLADEDGLRGEAIHTTDIVASPDSVLYDAPTLMVTYSRSGESPESVGALDYTQSRVTRLYNLAFVCKSGSSVSKYTEKLPGSLTLLMPPESCDLGFAMTSSVSCMALATWCALGGEKINERFDAVMEIADSVESEIETLGGHARRAAEWSFDRAAFLGCGEMRGLAREAAVKMLELTAGIVNASWDTPTGFRHGPKSLVGDTSVSVHFMSPPGHARAYDDDFLREMTNQRRRNKIVAVGASLHGAIGADAEVEYALPGASWTRIGAYIKGLVFAQLLALEKSTALGQNTDDPCAGGEVNRVVRGVTIHPLKPKCGEERHG